MATMSNSKLCWNETAEVIQETWK